MIRDGLIIAKTEADLNDFHNDVMAGMSSRTRPPGPCGEAP